MNKIIRLEIEYQDGTIEQALGEDADNIWGRFLALLGRSFIRTGRQYDGPQMKVIREGKKPCV